ncbi:MAG TPA: GGDEF domain-containing protein [Fontimonas sp.]
MPRVTRLAVDEDSDVIRYTFRRLCQRSAIVLSVTSLFYGAVMYWLGVHNWYLQVGLAMACVPLYWMQSVRRSYPVFLLAVLTMVTLLFAICTHSTLQFGRDADFQLILVAALPVVVVSGRINIRVKWALVTLFTVFLIWLDSHARVGTYPRELPPVALPLLRTMNYTVLIFATTGLVYQYFRLAARQYTALMEMAMLDPLTGLYNRRRMNTQAQQAMIECREQGQPLTVILCDLDHFKSINDTLGHDVGDAVLRSISRLLGEGIRTVDSVGRWGGEEFLLLLPQTDLEGATALANRLRLAIADPHRRREAAEPHVTATMGVAMLRAGDTLEQAISRADAALYAGKAGGRNRVVVESP